MKKKKTRNNPHVTTAVWYTEISLSVQSLISEEADICCLVYFSIGTSWKKTESGKLKIPVCKRLPLCKCSCG